jgi:hypothetical protein
MNNHIGRGVRVAGTMGVVLLGLAWMTGLGGCAAAAGVGGDVAESLAEKTASIVDIGKVESYQPVPIDVAIERVRMAAAELGLKLEKEDKHPDQLKLTYQDGRKLKIVVTVVRRTDKVTELHTDVGLFGVEGMAKLVMRQILRNLPGASAEDRRALE